MCFSAKGCHYQRLLDTCIISYVSALHCFSSICSFFIGLCVLGKVIGVLLMVALPPEAKTRSNSYI